MSAKSPNPSSFLATGLRYLKAYADMRNELERWGRKADTLIGDCLYFGTTDREKIPAHESLLRNEHP